MKRTFSLASLLLLMAVMLSACGFHLRGSSPNDRLPFRTIHLAFPDSSPLAIGLKRLLRGSDTTIVPDRKTAQVTLELLGENRGKAILSLNAQGRVREYNLTYTLRVQLKDASGKILLPPTAISQQRTLIYNEQQALANESEEADLYRDMQSDIAQQVIRRLTAVKFTPTPANAAPARKS